MIARVEPLTTTRRLSGPFDYAADGLALQPGSIVRIPFGHQQLDGVVVSLAETTDVPAEKLVAPTSTREDTVPPDLVDLQARKRAQMMLYLAASSPLFLVDR